MPFFHQNLSPLTIRHGHKPPAFEIDFRPREPLLMTSTSSTPTSEASTEKLSKRKSKLKPDYFWTAPAPVWKMETHKLESSLLDGEGDPFRDSLFFGSKGVNSSSRRDNDNDNDKDRTTTFRSHRVSANRAWEFSCPDFTHCEEGEEGMMMIMLEGEEDCSKAAL